MIDEIKGKLSWFLKNLNMLLEDLEFMKEEFEVELYFDTFDLRELALGMRGYYDGVNFDLDGIFQVDPRKPLLDRVLVNCLAIAGQLGTIKMLQPHQSEFLKLLGKDFRLSEIKESPSELVPRFLQSVRGTDTIKDEKASLAEPDENIIEHVRKHAGSAVNFYKVIHLVRKVTWQGRLAYLRRQKLLDLDPSHVDYTQIVHSDMFQRLKLELERKRPDFKPINNFADAVALSMLALQLEEYKNGVSKRIPRFFVSSITLGDQPMLSEVVKRAKLQDTFSYKSLRGTTSTVLREADYFVFRSAFQPIKQATSGQVTNNGHDFSSYDELRELRDQIQELLQLPGPIPPEQVQTIHYINQPISQIIDDLNNLLFFKNVWEPSSTEDAMYVLGELKNIAEQLTSDTFRQGVHDAIEATKDELEKNVTEYQMISSLWDQIKKAAKYIRSHLHGNLSDNLDIFRDFGLLRFAFPSEAHERITAVLEDLLGDDDEENQSARNSLVVACYLARHAPKEYVVDLAAAAAVLWVAERYSNLKEFLDRFEDLPHYSLDLIYAASVFQRKRGESENAKDAQEEQGLKVLQKLESELKVTKEDMEQSYLAIGMAYLYFHLWDYRGHRPIWDSKTNDDNLLLKDGGELIDRAITLATLAYEGLEEVNRKGKLSGLERAMMVYALNQVLYYLVMGSREPAQVFSRADDAAQLLLRHTEDAECWQYRFDDTLAHYYHWKAALADNEADWRRSMENAVHYSKRASRQAPWHEPTKDYHNILEIIENKGFERHSA